MSLKPFKFHYRTYSFTFSNIRSLVSSYRREREREEEEEGRGDVIIMMIVLTHTSDDIH